MSDDLRMSAYYYSFNPTGVPAIDKILSAVACAGKSYHHTEDWNEVAEWEPNTGKTPAAWIQNAANEAAAPMKWQPMETAPKDGTRVLVDFGSSRGVHSVIYSLVAELWILTRSSPYSCGAWKTSEGLGWMPMPRGVSQ